MIPADAEARQAVQRAASAERRIVRHVTGEEARRHIAALTDDEQLPERCCIEWLRALQELIDIRARNLAEYEQHRADNNEELH